MSEPFWAKRFSFLPFKLDFVIELQWAGLGPGRLGWVGAGPGPGLGGLGGDRGDWRGLALDRVSSYMFNENSKMHFEAK